MRMLACAEGDTEMKSHGIFMFMFHYLTCGTDRIHCVKLIGASDEIRSWYVLCTSYCRRLLDMCTEFHQIVST